MKGAKRHRVSLVPLSLVPVSLVWALSGVLLAVALPANGVAGAERVRGFDGTTLKVGGLGSVATFPDADVGTRARLARANTNREVRGVTFEVTSYRDDGNSSEAAAAASTALVEDDGVFAVVPNLSQFTPGDQLTRAGVPWFGWGIDPSYCTAAASERSFGFGYSGCLAPVSGGPVPATGAALYRELSSRTGAAAPSVAVVATATDGGRRMVSSAATSLAAAGLDVVFAEGLLAVPPASSPNAAVQELLQSRGGAPPDAVVCLASTSCVGAFQLLRANNYAGTLVSLSSADVPVRGLFGALAMPQYVPFTENTAAQRKLLSDVKAVKADATATPGVVAGYLAADMLVAALRELQRDGTSITPRHLQGAASDMTFRRAGLYGPVQYPNAFLRATPACEALARDIGSAWEQVDAYACTKKTVPLDPRFAQVH